MFVVKLSGIQKYMTFKGGRGIWCQSQIKFDEKKDNTIQSYYYIL